MSATHARLLVRDFFAGTPWAGPLSTAPVVSAPRPDVSLEVLSEVSLAPENYASSTVSVFFQTFPWGAAVALAPQPGPNAAPPVETKLTLEDFANFF
jgi:hypothetical protein